MLVLVWVGKVGYDHAYQHNFHTYRRMCTESLQGRTGAGAKGSLPDGSPSASDRAGPSRAR